MAKVLIIGAGGVGNVVVHKCAQHPSTFTDITLASRTLSRCEGIRDRVLKNTGREIRISQVDADDVQALKVLFDREKPELVINVALPYQDLSIMNACLAHGTDYLDTANYEPPDVAKFEYSWQWAYRERFEKQGLTAILGCGFDPGVTNAFCAYAQKHHFDTIATVDIRDANAGDHGQPFATNFNPEINIREITQEGRYWEKGEWKAIPPLSVHETFDFPEIGKKEAYLLYHEELESLAKNLRGLERIRFWMTFGDKYLQHLRVLEAVGMTSIKPVLFQGREIVPLQFLKAILPDPASLGPLTRGKTCIGCWITGKRGGRSRKYHIYNVCNHEEAYRETGSQAISYTTGVPAVIGARLVLEGAWKRKGVFNVEEMDPDPFMGYLSTHGLPWTEAVSDGGA
jgi:saccharopine dehydrogenase (NAD+, L-lysine-forming)